MHKWHYCKCCITLCLALMITYKHCYCKRTIMIQSSVAIYWQLLYCYVNWKLLHYVSYQQIFKLSGLLVHAHLTLAEGQSEKGQLLLKKHQVQPIGIVCTPEPT